MKLNIPKNELGGKEQVLGWQGTERRAGYFACSGCCLSHQDPECGQWGDVWSDSHSSSAGLGRLSSRAEPTPASCRNWGSRTHLVMPLPRFLPLPHHIPTPTHLSQFGKSLPPSPFRVFVVVCWCVSLFLSAVDFGWSKKEKLRWKCVKWLINPTCSWNSWFVIRDEDPDVHRPAFLWSPLLSGASLPCWVMVILALCRETNEDSASEGSVLASCLTSALLVVLRKEEETPQLLEAKQCGHSAWRMSQISASPLADGPCILGSVLSLCCCLDYGVVGTPPLKWLCFKFMDYNWLVPDAGNQQRNLTPFQPCLHWKMLSEFQC